MTLLSGHVLSAAAFAILAASAISMALSRMLRGPGGGLGASGPAAFLFEGARLIDATPAARRLMAGLDPRAGDLSALTRALAPRFGPDLSHRLARLPEGERLALPELRGPGLLEVAREEGALRLALHGEAPEAMLDRLALEAAEAELARLRALAESAPGPIWALDATGALAWANRAYLALADLSLASGAGRGEWPAEPLFDPPAGLGEGQVEVRRLPLTLPGRPAPEWFEVTSVRRGDGSVHFAAEIGSLVAAEARQATFAALVGETLDFLPAGLAVFDRRRRLVLSNRAFADLTGLSVTFLGGRPLMHTVLDRLRDAQVLPEPRDYPSWREAMAALESAAAGERSETWSQPDGRTLRITGRPHADGALAFLVEDITDEVALARRAHAGLDTAQGVIDAIRGGLAVFTSAGTMALSNPPYDALWTGPARTALAGPTLTEELARWERACGPARIWDEIRRGAVPGGEVREAVVEGPDGARLQVRATRLAAGGLVVGFSPATESAPWLAAAEARAPFARAPAPPPGPADGEGVEAAAPQEERAGGRAAR